MCLIVIALAWVLALAAEAQPIKEGPAARQHAATAPSRLGVDFYRAGYYASALVKLEAAYGLREAIDYEERWLLAAGASLVVAGGVLLSGRACGATARATAAELGSREAFTPRDLEALNGTASLLRIVDLVQRRLSKVEESGEAPRGTYADITAGGLVQVRPTHQNRLRWACSGEQRTGGYLYR